LPWVLLTVTGLRAMPRVPDQQWVVVASVAAVGVIVITGATLDYRFFSFALMLPWVFLAMIRRVIEP